MQTVRWPTMWAFTMVATKRRASCLNPKYRRNAMANKKTMANTDMVIAGS